MTDMTLLDEELADLVSQFYADPLGFVMFAFPWTTDNSMQMVKLPKELQTKYKSEFGPDKWACDFLQQLGGKVRERRFDGVSAVDPIREAIVSGHGVGKLLTLNTIIDTPDGKRRWGDIQPGDYLFGLRHKVKVIATRRYTDIPLYRVTFDDRSYCDVSTGHLWTVKGRNQRRTGADWITLSTEDIVRRGVLRKNGVAMARQWEIPQHSSVDYPAKKVTIEPYLMGMWLGNGSAGTGTFVTPDEEVFNRIKALGREINARKEKDKNCFRVSVMGLQRQLKDYGILGKRSYEKFIPQEYKENTVEVRAELLRALLDSDGTAGKEGGVGYTSTSKQLIEDVIWLVRSLGGKAHLQPTVKKPYYTHAERGKVEGRPAYNATIRMPDGFVYFHTKRKQDRVSGKSEARYLTRWIDSIEPLPPGDGMCVEVDSPDGLYLANDFIVTHNSAMVGWLVNWIMSTRPYTQGTVTATTNQQLRTKTWAQISLWHRRSITSHWFDITSSAASMRMVHKQYPEAWFCQAQSCAEENSEAFAGQHAANSTSFYIFDEASGVPDKIDEVSEGGLTDGEPMKFAFGNGTQNTGWFRECFRKMRHRWGTCQIDSRDVQITNKTILQQWVDDYGEDSDFVKVRVRGMFPAQSSMQLISTADVDAAFGRHLRKEQFDFAPKILTCDPAWTGEDELVIGLRQGLMFKVLLSLPKNDNDVEVASLLAILEDEHEADGVIMDGGFGTGIVSAGQTMGRNWLVAWFSAKSPDAGCVNLRAYIWKCVRDWLKSGGSIQDDKVLYEDLIGPQILPRFDGKLQLESKEDMKRRGVPSPNRGDALALSFAYPIAAKSKHPGILRSSNKNTVKEHDPYGNAGN